MSRNIFYKTCFSNILLNGFHDDVNGLYSGPRVQLTNHSGFQINKDGTWNMFSCSSLTEEGVEGIISSSYCLITGHLSIRLDTVLQTVKLPACISHLGPSLANMHRDTFTLKEKEGKNILI